MLRLVRALRHEQGFTLIEVLVALVVIAVVLTSIASLTGASVKASRTVDRNIWALAQERRILADLEQGSKLQIGRRSGSDLGAAWQIDVRPLSLAVPAHQARSASSRWVPVLVTVRLIDHPEPSGQFSVIRLIPRTER